MTDEDIIKVWDGLDAEAFDADTILRFARAIQAELSKTHYRTAQVVEAPPGPRHYTMKLETGHLVARSGRDSGDRG
jgi:hypothetical protein